MLQKLTRMSAMDDLSGEATVSSDLHQVFVVPELRRRLPKRQRRRKKGKYQQSISGLRSFSSSSSLFSLPVR